MKLSSVLLILLFTFSSYAVTKNDADNDGISDMMDKCPRTPGNSTVSAYGCTKGEQVVISVDVNFATNSVVVGPQYRSQVKKLADFLKANPEVNVELKGYADKRGTVAHNKTLSKQRAEAIREILLKDYDVQGSRVQAVGIGESAFAAPHKGAEGRYRNRRVEARIIQ